MPGRDRAQPDARPARPAARSGQWRDLLVWLLLVAAGLGAAALAVRSGARLGTAAPPFTGSWRRPALVPASLLAPGVAAATLAAVVAGWHRRLRWGLLPLAGYAITLAWALALALVDGGNGLAGPVSAPREYLADVPAVDGDPRRFLATFVQHGPALSVAGREHPPLPVLLLWAAERAGVHRPVALGLLLTAVGAAVTPLLLVAVRSLCGEASARNLAPVAALAPYALWTAVSMDAVTAALGAGMVAAGVVASERGRPGPVRLVWASVCGLLLGTAALFSYAVVWLAVCVICVYFVRRRPLLNVASGVCALLPLAALQALGFGWTDGLRMARRELATRVDAERSALVWGGLTLVVLLIAAGPALVAAARKVRLTPGWPFLVGAGLGVAYAILAGLSRGEAERSWLPFFPWLLVAAVAPEHRGEEAAPTPVLLVATGAVAAIVLQAVLRSPW
jgi:methylthioxylose transferase